MKIDEIFDRFEYLVHHARRVPFSSRVMVDEDEVMDLIDQLRFNLPEEIKEASWTVQEQQRLISEAHNEAARILSKANERAESVVSNQEILKRADRQAQHIVQEAESKADLVIREAESYALDQLKQLEAHLGRTMATVKRGVEALQPTDLVPPDDRDPGATIEDREPVSQRRG